MMSPTLSQQELIRQSQQNALVKKAWNDWLKDMTPSHFGTLSISRTHATGSPHEDATRAFRQYFIKVSSKAGGRIRAIAATERSPSTGRLHVHFLLYGAECVATRWLDERWDWGERNRIEVFNPEEGDGALYVVKNCLFDNEGVIEILPKNWSDSI
jgi:hypothetical protein